MAIYKNGEIYKGDTEKAPDNSVGALLTSDAKLNRSIEDYITLATKAATLLDVINRVAFSEMYDSEKVKVIKTITKEEDV